MTVTGIDVLIEPDHSLAETARIVSSALGIALEEEVTGRFEEFPAYLAERAGVMYALLGPPEREHDIRENPTNDYCLQVWPESSGAAEPVFDYVVGILRAVGLRVS